MVANLKDRAKNLFSFIENAIKLNLIVPINLSSFEFKLFEHQIFNNKYIVDNVRNSNTDDFIKIKQVVIEKPPVLPDELSQYIINYPSNPQLIDNLLHEEKIKIIGVWNNFKPKYEKWKIENKQKLEAQSIFNQLIELISDRNETHEFVLGHGIISWNFDQKSCDNINYPLITIKLSVIHDVDNKEIIIKPLDDSIYHIEELVLNKFVNNVSDIKSEFKEIQYDLSSVDSYTPFFEYVLNRFHKPDVNTPENGEIIKDINIQPPTEDLKIYDTWGIFYRKRRFQAEIQDFSKYIEIFDNESIHIENTSLKAFIEDPSDEPVNYTFGNYRDIDVITNTDILFPLEFNQAQIEILDKVEKLNNVIVQGPPGTGKSHTIANLISHYLSTGKKVLVTSKKDQALDVLLNKIPEKLRKFCIPILSGVPDSNKKMKEAFDGIDDAVKTDINKINENLTNLKREIKATSDKLIDLQNKMEFSAKSQLNKILYDENAILPVELIEILKQHENKHKWLQDTIKYDVKITSEGYTKIISIYSFTEEELGRLSSLKKEFGNNFPSLFKKRVKTNKLVNPDKFKTLVENIKKYKELEIFCKYSTTKKESPETINQKISSSKQINENWQLELFNVLKNNYLKTQITKQLASINENIMSIDGLRKQFNIFDEIIIRSSLTPKELKCFVDKLNNEVQNDKKVYGLMAAFRLHLSKSEIDTLKSLKIDNKKPETKQEWNVISLYTSIITLFENTICAWNKLSNLENMHNIPKYEYILENINKESNERVYTFSIEGYEAFKILVDKFKCVLELDTAYYNSTNEKESLLKYLSKNIGEGQSILNQKLYDALNGISNSPENAILIWTQAYNQLEKLETIEPKFNEFISIYNKIKEYMPIWAKNILLSKNNELYPTYWKESIEYKATVDYIKKINVEAKKLSDYENEYAFNYKKLKNLKLDLINNTAIKNIKSNTTPKNLTDLAEWQMALKNLGKGTGKNAIRWRKILKEKTKEAQTAIPVWIMPSYKVSETLPSEIGTFDVVIIDEASQSDMCSFLVLLRGKKVIIVGDPEQVSPINIGANISQGLCNKYLTDLPRKDYYNFETSIYDLSEMAFSGNAVMLTEHFRCLPEIIRFSNDLCYNNKITPLRYVPENEKLKPVLECIYVETGMRRNNIDVNDKEIEAICKKVVELIQNKQYENKTIGIISLLGMDQAKYIYNSIMQYISLDDFIKHKIRVGDSATFQGDERDIVILSMVVSPRDTKNITALTHRRYKQRFNVAVSRARDKLILVHSIKQNEIPNQNCMRYKLLEFMNNGIIIDPPIGSPRFDSKFEEEVYNIFTQKGYNVFTQVEVGSYRIDLVIEGGQERLGIECDGDKYHTPDRWLQDSLRQKQLERMGWTIYRIWGSDFYNRRDEIVNEIIEKLNAMHIYPHKTNN